MSANWVGWISSFLLIGTMAKQISKQWEQRSSEGVSQRLYLGQFAAEIGFVAYSVLVLLLRQRWMAVARGR